MAPPDPDDAEGTRPPMSSSSSFAESQLSTPNPSSTSVHTYRAVALDLDGTLLQSNHQLSQATIDYLQYLRHERNITILIATGRAAPSTYEHVLKLNFNDGLPLVCSNGAKGMICRVREESNRVATKEHTDSSSHQQQQQQQQHMQNNEIKTVLHHEQLFDMPVPKHVVLRTLELAFQLGNHTMVQYYHGDSICANATTSSHHSLMQRYMRLTGSKVQVVTTEEMYEFLQLDRSPSKLLVLFPTEAEETALHTFQQELGYSKVATIVRGSYGWFLEVLHPQVSKGHGLERMLLNHLKIPMSQCIAFGDGDNDMEFLQMAGLGIAMRNAKPHIQAIANQVTEFSNDDEGVIRTLQAMELKGLLSA